MTQLSLTNPRLVEYNGICYLLGLSAGTAYLMKSADCGETWLPFSGGTTQSPIGPCDEHGGALVKLHSQGGRLLAALPHQSQIHIYMSADDGDTWSLDSTPGEG
jgi:hypothetical protein